MKTSCILFLLFIGIYAQVYAQSDACATATPLTVSTTCSSPTSGTTAGATQSLPGCVGNADDDVWYSFVATATSHVITVVPSANMDPVVQLFSGSSCSGLVSLSCMDNNFLAGGTETLTYAGLTIGSTYRIRVYHYGTGSGSGNFTICVTKGGPPPSNDACSGALPLPINTSCSTTSGSLYGATPTSSLPACSGTADDDVWYSFVATSPSHTITASTNDMIDLVFQVFSGSCGSLTSIACVDNNYTNGGTETTTLIGLSVGATYYVRVYDFYNNHPGNFSICVVGASSSVPNDEPCNALAIPTVTSACNYMEFTTIGATASMSAPTPSSCIGGSGAQIGGFSSSSGDVWFAITVPPSGNITITNKPTVNGYLSDAVMALYTGTCTNLTQITCSDDHPYPPFPTNANPTPSPNRFRPMINATGLTPGSTVYLRYWGWGTNKGKFGFCVTTGVNDDCINALYICDLNGYSASTSASFTSDRPGNMHGNNESPTGTSMTDGQNSGGPFGYYPSNNVAGPYSSPAIDVEIDNNSWIRFTAASTTVKLKVSIYDCFREAAGRSIGGIQMQIFDYTGCTASSVFTPISQFKEGWGTFTIQTIDPLVIGQDYILMVDGFAGDICNYTISAESGVKFPEITPPDPICSGAAVTLTAPPGATSYLWLHDSTTTQSITVNPATTTTYLVQVEGLCGYRQTLSVQVTVKSPFIEITTPSTTICAGGTATLTASAGATSYLWTDAANNTIGTTQTILVSPTSSSTYTIKATVNDCQASKTITINVSPPPIVSINVSPNDSICSGDTITLTASGASIYTWDNGLANGPTHALAPTSTTTYKVIGKNGTCSDSTTQKITVVAPPTINGSALVSPSNCSSNTGSISGLSASGSGITYSWEDSNNTVVSTTASASGLAPGTYTLTVTNSLGCSATSSPYTLGNTAAATVGLSSDKSAICNGGSATLTATGATSYSWDNALPSGSTNTVSPTTTTVYTVTGTDANGCTNTASLTITVNATPTSVAITPSQNGAICIGDSAITLTASGASTYSWSNGATTPAITVSPLTPTSYSVTATDGNGCSGSASYLLTVNPLPTVSADGLSVGLSNCDIANGSISGLVIGGTAPFLYSWTNASGTVVGTTLDVSGLPAGTYTLEVMDNNLCIATFGVVTVNNPPTPASPTIGADKNLLCEGETVTLTMSSTYMAGTTSDWTLPNGTTTAQMPLQINNFSASDEGNYCLSSTYLGCVSDTQCLTLSMLPAPTVQIVNSGSELTICQGSTAVLSASGATSYVWTGPNSFLWSGATVQVAPFNPINEGVYTVKGIDINGCSHTDSVFVSMLSNPILSLSSDGMLNLYCEHTQALLTATGASTYDWTGPNNFSSSGSVISIPEMTPSRAGWYVVTGVDEHGCLATDSIKLGLSIPNMPIVLDDRHVVCPGETVHFSVDLPQASAYSWVGPNGHITDLPYFTLDSVLAHDVGWYYFTAFDSIGCPQQDSIYLSVELRASCLHIPDLITPDGDNFNDTWHIPHLHYFSNVEVSIFNRWGTIIYHTSSYQNEWYGQINKNNQTVLSNTGVVPVGTYFFIMTLNDPQKTPPIKGIIDVQY